MLQRILHVLETNLIDLFAGGIRQMSNFFFSLTNFNQSPCELCRKTNSNISPKAIGQCCIKWPTSTLLRQPLWLIYFKVGKLQQEITSRGRETLGAFLCHIFHMVCVVNTPIHAYRAKEKTFTCMFSSQKSQIQELVTLIITWMIGQDPNCDALQPEPEWCTCCYCKLLSQVVRVKSVIYFSQPGFPWALSAERKSRRK